MVFQCPRRPSGGAIFVVYVVFMTHTNHTFVWEGVRLHYGTVLVALKRVH